MSVDQQHLDPALKAVAAKSGHSLGKTSTSLKYVRAPPFLYHVAQPRKPTHTWFQINECLAYLLDRIARLHAHVELHKSHQAASAAIATAAKAELAAGIPPVSKPRPVPASPVRTRKADDYSRASPGLQESPIETLLQNLAVSLPEDANPRDKIAHLAKILSERTQKCTDISKGAQESFEITARAQIQDARQAIQLLRDSVLAESPFGDVKLVDPDIEGSILILAQEVDKAKEKLRVLEGQSVVAGSEKKEDLIQRWGS